MLTIFQSHNVVLILYFIFLLTSFRAFGTIKVVAVMGEPLKRVTDGLKGLFVALIKAGAIEKYIRLATPEIPEPAFLRLILRNTDR